MNGTSRNVHIKNLCSGEFNNVTLSTFSLSTSSGDASTSSTLSIAIQKKPCDSKLPAHLQVSLNQFESEIHDLVKNVMFKPYKTNPLQTKMNEDIKNIKRDDKVYVAAENIKFLQERYQELLENNITKEYNKFSDKVVDQINDGDKKLAKKIELKDRIYSMGKRQSYITVKDHKESFPNNVKCRLINPSKSELGKVSKRILSNIVETVRNKTKLNHWKNSESVINWFVNLQGKERASFIQFDIKEFYPSIRKILLTKSLNYAIKFVKISAQDKNIIFQCRNSILFNDEKPWNKKGNDQFDVTMGSWDGAEICEIVGLYLLSELSKLGFQVGLYRDDGLCLCSLNPRQTELMKKKLCKVFSDNGLNITVEANVKNVNFLDINLDLETELFKPFMKPNDKPVYVHKLSNHPPGIIKNIPQSVNKRLNTISANENVFSRSAFFS